MYNRLNSQEARGKGKYYALAVLNGLITKADAIERMSVLTKGTFPHIWRTMLREFFAKLKEGGYHETNSA